MRLDIIDVGIRIIINDLLSLTWMIMSTRTVILVWGLQL